MDMIYAVGFVLTALALAYDLRLTEETLYMGRELSGVTSGTGVQAAITPPISVYLGFGLYALTLAIVVVPYFYYGFWAGLGLSVLFVALLMLIRRFLLRKAHSAHFRGIVTQSMIGRFANYVRDGDKLRAATMKDLLEKAGFPVDELSAKLGIDATPK